MTSTMKTHTSKTSNSMLVLMAVDTFHKLRQKKGLELSRGKMLGGMYARPLICRKEENLNEQGMQKDESDIVTAAVEVAREYAKIKPTYSVGRAGLHKKDLWASWAARSSHNHILL